jgi:hypothetical protein
MVGAGAEIFDKLEPEPKPHKNGPAPQHVFLFFFARFNWLDTIFSTGSGQAFSLCSAPVLFQLQQDPQLLSYINQFEDDLLQVFSIDVM